MRGQELTDHRVEFECDRLRESNLLDDALVVTTNPFAPSKYTASDLVEFGGSGIFVLQAVLGDQAEAYFTAESIAEQLLEERWPSIRRLYAYYLAENWAAFDKSGAAAFEDWRLVSTMHERATIASQALGILCLHVVGRPSSAADTAVERMGRKHLAAINKPAYMDLLRADGGSGQIAALQRSVFETVELFLERSETWASGRLFRALHESRADALKGLVLFRDEFVEVRDLYQRGFEVVCKTLRYMVAAQNSIKRNDPNDFGGDHPSNVPVKSRPSSLAKFDKLPNAYRLAYVVQVPGWADFAELLDNRVRNAIGHATVRHDLRSGQVVSDSDPDGMSYLSFVGRTFGVFEALTVALHVLRHARVASSPDFR